MAVFLEQRAESKKQKATGADDKTGYKAYQSLR
jgi:hypothetical protein